MKHNNIQHEKGTLITGSIRGEYSIDDRIHYFLLETRSRSSLVISRSEMCENFVGGNAELLARPQHIAQLLLDCHDYCNRGYRYRKPELALFPDLRVGISFERLPSNGLLHRLPGNKSFHWLPSDRAILTGFTVGYPLLDIGRLGVDNFLNRGLVLLK